MEQMTMGKAQAIFITITDDRWTNDEKIEAIGGNVPLVMFENHAQDSRYKGPLEVAQPVTATYGMGGNNQPLVVFSKVRRAKSKDDFETWCGSEVTNTLNNFDNGDVRTTECVICMATQQGGQR